MLGTLGRAMRASHRYTQTPRSPGAKARAARPTQAGQNLSAAKQSIPV